jgi:uncharacterized protein YndB with AHSA1/START domain
MSVKRSVAEPILAGAEVLSRIFDAPRELVFEAWTKVEHFTRWFGPHGAEMRSCEIDPRPGGTIRFAHWSEDGTHVNVKGKFREVLQDRRLVFTIGFVDEDGRPGRHPMFPDWPLDALMETTALFEDAGQRTQVTVVQRTLPPEVASHAAVERHQQLAREGWKQVFERLEEHLATRRDLEKHRT